VHTEQDSSNIFGSSISRKSRENLARIGREVLIASLSTILVDRCLGLGRFSDHFLIQFLMLNKNMAVRIIQVGTTPKTSTL
jgi:hypothetical protein